MPLQLTTRRMVLVAATLEIARAEAREPARLPALLDADIPDAWPPPLNDEASITWTATFLENDPEAVGWATWYFLVPGPGGRRSAVGNGGFKGRPTPDGTVEIGYSILEARQRQGFAPEAVEALVQWAFTHPEVRRVVAQTLPDLRASIRVLEKSGFRFVGPGADPESILYERPRGA